VLASQESARLANNAYGFLLFLEQSGVLTSKLREMVINRVMALESDSEVDIEELKWVVMMVLFNSSDEQDENALMHYEDIVFADQPAIFH
jgi:Smg protein